MYLNGKGEIKFHDFQYDDKDKIILSPIGKTLNFAKTLYYKQPASDVVVMRWQRGGYQLKYRFNRRDCGIHHNPQYSS
ncbi:hypothetical protein FACS189465_3660 [Clostridia bacterium]|nr:hypothetical protein FACS189465_3660 [Clostridia bacterium]